MPPTPRGSMTGMATIRPWRWNDAPSSTPSSCIRDKRIHMSLIFTLASRNLCHDRVRFIATVVGIVFSIVLVTVQAGLYLGFGRTVTTMIDHATGDQWIVPSGTKSFEDPSLLDE